MEAQPSLMRLALGGLLLDPRAFRAQRDAPGGARRGFVLVLLIGLLVGIAALIGNFGETLTQPDPQLVSETLVRGIKAMPWYQQALEESPALAESVEQSLARPGAFSFTPTPLASLVATVLAPVLAVLGWLISSTVVHLSARAFGGVGRFGQTLATTALASGASLLGLVQVVPYAEQIPGSLGLASGVLGLLATYVAVRETHSLPPWRSVWAVTLGPLLLGLLVLGLYCCVVIFFAGALENVMQGGAR